MAESSNSTTKCFNFIQTVFPFIARFSDSIKHLGQQKRTSSPQTRPLYSTSSTAAFSTPGTSHFALFLPQMKAIFSSKGDKFPIKLSTLPPPLLLLLGSRYTVWCVAPLHCTHSDSNKLINTYTESVWSSLVVWLL